MARLLTLAAVLLTVLAGASMLAHVWTVQSLPGWMFGYRRTIPLDLAPLLGIATITVLVGWLVPRGPWSAAPGIVALGLATQFGLAFAEGQGLQPLYHRALRSGHAEFIREAARPLAFSEIITDYEAIAGQPGQEFTPSKPPGQLVVYRVIARIGGEAEVPGALNPAHGGALRATIIALPVLAALGALPVLWLGSILLPKQDAAWPALLYVVSPSFALITLHLDQALYPALATLAVALALRGRSAAAGIVAWVGTFVSFSLLPAVLLAWVHSRTRWRLLGTVAALSGVAWLAGYDAVHRFSVANAWHQAFKPLPWADRVPLGLAEFLWWLGPGLAIPWVAARTPLARSTLFLVAALAIYGTAQAETARLWLFLVPSILVAMVPSTTHIPVLVAIQLAYTFVMKRTSDFY